MLLKKDILIFQFDFEYQATGIYIYLASGIFPGNRNTYLGGLDVTSTHKPTTRHSDPHHTSTKYFVHCDNFLLWHFDYVTFFYCDILTLWQFLLWHFDHVTFFYCDIPTLWHFSTVSVHPKKWEVCHTVTFRPTVILANPWLWHFVHFGFWFFPAIPCQSCSWFLQMTILWHYPFNFLASTHWFRRLTSDRGFSKGVFFRLFFQSDRSFGSYSDFWQIPAWWFWPLWHFVHPLWKEPEGFQVVPGDLWQNVHISLQSKSGCPVTIQVKKGGRPITVTKCPTFRGVGR